MAKDKLTDYDSTTASNNTDVGGISIAEGMLPSAVNNSIRELTKQLGAFADGTDGIDVLSLADDDASHAIKLQAPSAVTADTTFTLPDGDGTADQVLKTDGSGQLGFADRHPNPSLIINGAMQVWQRGVSDDTASNGDYTCDRWCLQFNGLDGNVDWDQETSSVPDGFAYALKVSTDASESSLDEADFLKINQRFEGQNLQHLQKGAAGAKSITLSFWVKSSVASTYTLELEDRDNTRVIGKSYTINSADTWEHKSVVFEGDTSSPYTNDANESLRMSFYIDAGSNYTSGTFSTAWQATDATERVYDTTGWLESTSPEFYITGVKLEVGETATPFEHRSYGDELLRCQRYCYRPFVSSASTEDAELGWPRFFASLYASGGQVHITYPVSMRKDPVLTYSVQAGTIDTDQSSYVKATLRDSDDTAFYLYNFQADAEL